MTAQPESVALSDEAETFPIGVQHRGIRFHLGDPKDTLRLLFTMVRDGVCTVDQAMDCIKLESHKSCWQPIETAPKDGTIVLVGRDMGESWGFVRGTGFYHGGSTIHGWVCRGIVDPPGELGLGNPTHWMPLPEPPK